MRPCFLLICALLALSVRARSARKRFFIDKEFIDSLNANRRSLDDTANSAPSDDDEESNTSSASSGSDEASNATLIRGPPEMSFMDTVSMAATIERIKSSHASDIDGVLAMRKEFNEFLVESATSEGSCYLQTYKGVSYESVVESSVMSFCSYIKMNFTDAQFAWIDSLASNVQSLKSCSSAPTVRKEIRQYSVSERKEIYQSIVDMKNTYIDNLNQYDMFAEMHRPTSGPSGTRAGVATWAWHREYLFRFEKAMQEHNPNVSLPYWDTSLDRYIPYPSETALFSSTEFGTKMNLNSNSRSPFTVSDGPFADWEIHETCAESYGKYYVDRTVTERSDSMPRLYSYSRWEIEEYLLNMTTFTDLATDKCLLRDHDNLHGYIGGVTAYEVEKSCAVVDPIVWFMHNYLDYIWQQFREKAQTTDLNSDYTTGDDVQACHTWDADMHPFEGMKNIDGLSDMYQKCYYTFEDSPTTCESTADCGSSSDLLWCDTTIGWCKTKIAVGGTCTLMTDESCAGRSECVNDACTIPTTDDAVNVQSEGKQTNQANEQSHDGELRTNNEGNSDRQNIVDVVENDEERDGNDVQGTKSEIKQEADRTGKADEMEGEGEQPLQEQEQGGEDEGRAKRMWIAPSAAKRNAPGSKRSIIDAFRLQSQTDSDELEKEALEKEIIDAVEEKKVLEKKKSLFAKLVTLLAERIFGQNRATSVV